MIMTTTSALAGSFAALVNPETYLPLAFAGVLGLSILLYVILDGFDLGVGIVLPLADDVEKDRMIASIGPFWDANETWLVLAIGIVLVAFPSAHGVILGALYLPVSVMLIALVLRGVAFEFRTKAPSLHKTAWNRVFFAASLVTALSQGFMLGLYIMGLDYSLSHVLFALLTAFCVAAGYSFIGAAWLIWKSDDELQQKAIGWARIGLIGTTAGLIAISVASPLVSPRIFARWFSLPQIALLSPLPVVSAILIARIWLSLDRLQTDGTRRSFVPFASATALFAITFAGLAYSFYPYIVPQRLTIYEAASAPESLFLILIGVLVVLPVIIAYTVLSYVVFRGKATELRYD